MLLVRAYDEQLMSPQVCCAENQLNHSVETQKMNISSLAEVKVWRKKTELQENRVIFDNGLGGLKRH